MPTVVESLRAPTYLLMFVPPLAILGNPERLLIQLTDLQSKEEPTERYGVSSYGTDVKWNSCEHQKASNLPKLFQKNLLSHGLDTDRRHQNRVKNYEDRSKQYPKEAEFKPNFARGERSEHEFRREKWRRRRR